MVIVSLQANVKQRMTSLSVRHTIPLLPAMIINSNFYLHGILSAVIQHENMYFKEVRVTPRFFRIAVVISKLCTEQFY